MSLKPDAFDDSCDQNRSIPKEKMIKTSGEVHSHLTASVILLRRTIGICLNQKGFDIKKISKP